MDNHRPIDSYSAHARQTLSEALGTTPITGHAARFLIWIHEWDAATIDGLTSLVHAVRADQSEQDRRAARRWERQEQDR